MSELLSQTTEETLSPEEMLAVGNVMAAFDLPRDVAMNWLDLATEIDEPIDYGKEAQETAVMHAVAKQVCSEKYKTIRNKRPDLSKQEINQLPELSVLNAVRRGLKRRSTEYYEKAKNQNRPKPHRPIGRWVD